MPWFQVVLRGEHFLIHKDGSDQWMGFIKNLYVEAPDADTAENLAVQRAVGDPELKLRVRNPADKPPELNLEEVSPVEASPDLVDSPFVFHPDEAPPA